VGEHGADFSGLGQGEYHLGFGVVQFDQPLEPVALGDALWLLLLMSEAFECHF